MSEEKQVSRVLGQSAFSNLCSGPPNQWGRRQDPWKLSAGRAYVMGRLSRRSMH